MLAGLYAAPLGAARADDCEGCPDAPCNNSEAGLCCADINGDGVVDDDDLDLFIAALVGQDCSGECGCVADLNRDGVVNECDICIMDHEYGTSCAGYSLLPLETWNLLCYDPPGCDDPNCENDPNLTNSCCPRHCTPCLANKGCLPLETPCMTFQDLDGDGWVDALVWAREPADPNGVPLRVREIIIDGQLDQDTYGCDYNVVVLDVTDPNNPVTIGALKAYTFPGNNRTFIPVPPDPNDPNAFVIPADPSVTRTYDVRVRVTSYRANALSDLSALSGTLGVTVTGGLSLVNSSGADLCTQTMSLQFGGSSYTSPVKVRLSRMAN